MSQDALTYRDDGQNRSPVKPSSREEFIRAELEKKFGVKDPQRWIAVQKEAERPDVESWRMVLRADFRIRLPDEAFCIALFRRFGERVHYPPDPAQSSAFYLVASLLDRLDVELYAGKGGYYLVTSEQGRLLRFRTAESSSAKFRRYGEIDLTDIEEGVALLESTIFPVWEAGGELDEQACSFVCEPYAKAIEAAAHEADEQYGRATIVGWKVRHSLTDVGTEMRAALAIPHVVVWTCDKGVYHAWRFKGEEFTPDSFINCTPERTEMTELNVEEFLYGSTGVWIFQTRHLLEMLKHLWKMNLPPNILRCTMSKRGEPPQPDEEILFIQKSRIRGQLPSGGDQLL